jgi:hypothetical protein
LIVTPDPIDQRRTTSEGELGNPWLRAAGILDKDDPLVKEWIEIMRENRRKDEEVTPE